MPGYLKQLSREAYCSAPPLPSTSIRPPQLTRETEAGRPRAPLRAPIGKEVKAELSSIDLVEFFADDVKPDVKQGIPFDPLKIGDPLQASLAALAIRPSSSTSSVDEGAAAAPGPSRHQEPWGLQWQSHGRILQRDCGPADQPWKSG